MSVLETPRIYFRGEIAWDPIVTNNYSEFYNENASETVFPTAADKVAAFRAEAIKAVTPRNWNPHGTHRSSFFNSSISGADLGGGSVENDPFVGSPALFMGMLVDLEPYGTISSQLFFDAMSFGIAGGYRITAPRKTRITSRYINFFRNPDGAKAGVASVVWQTCFSKADGLRIDAFDSPSLQALQNALVDDDVLGITVQFNAYRTIYYNDPVKTNPELVPPSKVLTTMLEGGGWQPNPARSMMVGVIGLWRAGEPVNEPCDRTLITGPDANPDPPPFVGSAHCRVDQDSIVLDLSNSISEDGIDLTKHNFGDLTVVAVHPVTQNAVTLATFGYTDYDEHAYLRTSGIVTLPVDRGAAAVAKTGHLQLRDASKQVLLAEAPLRALPLVPNLYLNEGDTHAAQWQVYDRGAPAHAGIEVTIYVMSADGNTVQSSFELTTDARGMVSFPVTGTRGSITPYVSWAGPDPQPPQGINPQTNTYMYVRTLAADDDLAQLEPTWENVYERVLANWNAMAPCMDNWLNLADPAQVISFAPLIFKLTSAAAFEHFRYMPVTRDLTPGARTLLYNFLNNPPAPAPKAAMLGAEQAEEPAAKEKVNFAKLNRNMRGNE
jgi:hypothetical protein